MSSLAVRNIGELVTNDRSIGAGPMGRRFNAAVVIDQGIVVWIGGSAKARAADNVIGACDSAVIPGFVDSHTHLILAAMMGGARALRRSDVGYLGLGARGDLVALDAPRVAHVSYRPGSSLAQLVVQDGVTTSLEDSISQRPVSEDVLLASEKGFTRRQWSLGGLIVDSYPKYGSN